MNIQLDKIKVLLPGTAKVLFRLNRLEIPTASHILLYGASGTGKTTLLHLIAGLFIADEGTVAIGDFRLNTMNPEERAVFRSHSIGFIFQKLNLIDYLTVRENIELGGVHRKLAAAAAENALRAVGLQDRSGELCARLSLGEQQRVAAARVLANDCKIILADEPTSSLDSKNADKVIDHLFEAAGTTRTLVVVSHDDRIHKRFEKRFRFEDMIQ